MKFINIINSKGGWHAPIAPPAYGPGLNHFIMKKESIHLFQLRYIKFVLLSDERVKKLFHIINLLKT